MKTKAVRLYGKMDLRLEEFELPAIKEDEILVKVSADSLCMSSYKAAKLGESLLGFNGCMNFFAGPTDEKLSANLESSVFGVKKQSLEIFVDAIEAGDDASTPWEEVVERIRKRLK